MARAEYLGHLDGLAYGSDPRNGFFRDGVFFHPALRFRFDIPAEWNAQNLTDAVVAVNPRRDAAIQLTLSPDNAPAAAVRRFIGQGGIRVLQSFRQPVSGSSEQGCSGSPRTLSSVMRWRCVEPGGRR